MFSLAFARQLFGNVFHARRMRNPVRRCAGRQLATPLGCEQKTKLRFAAYWHFDIPAAVKASAAYIYYAVTVAADLPRLCWLQVSHAVTVQFALQLFECGIETAADRHGVVCVVADDDYHAYVAKLDNIRGGRLGAL